MLASLHCTYEEIASAFGLSTRTIERRVADDEAFREVIERGRADGRRALRRALWGLALKANTAPAPAGSLAALIFLCKQPEAAGGLGMSDRGAPLGAPAEAADVAGVAAATAADEAFRRDLEEKLATLASRRRKKKAAAR